MLCFISVFVHPDPLTILQRSKTEVQEVQWLQPPKLMSRQKKRLFLCPAGGGWFPSSPENTTRMQQSRAGFKHQFSDLSWTPQEHKTPVTYDLTWPSLSTQSSSPRVTSGPTRKPSLTLRRTQLHCPFTLNPMKSSATRLNCGSCVMVALHCNCTANASWWSRSWAPLFQRTRSFWVTGTMKAYWMDWTASWLLWLPVQLLAKCC